MKILGAAKARNAINRLIDEAAESHEPIHVSGIRSNTILVSEDDW